MKSKLTSLIVRTIKVFFLFFSWLPMKKRLIVFESFLGKQYSDNPRAIYEYLKKVHPDFRMYWSVDRKYEKNFLNKDIRTCKRLSFKWVYLMARAEFWVTNSRLPLWIPKPKHTTYIQTWHGTPLKKLALDMEEVYMPGTNTTKYKENFVNEVNKWDYLVSPNAYSTKIFRRAFAFKGEIVESGYPRNDYLINSNNDYTVSKIKTAADLPKDKKIILYAPTWRDNQFYSKGSYKFNLQIDLEKMREELQEEYILVLRLHYLISENIDLSRYGNFVYDLSHYGDIKDLYLISDILITDYSSVFFDFANLKRPILFFTYDLEQYRDTLRGFYFDIEKNAPGALVKDTLQIIYEIRKVERNGYNPSKIAREFYNKFCYLEDGNATKRLVEKVFFK
ncbi:CDP-glycerol glycerophosphotransferase family protein [Virgibacillus pantothenticus]|uniref:CDP-glycerol glycerophosphotransferase family protein n=1 Tax=Virgibacillus pantothenticus TaxID=1473 RepID=UPI0025AF642E|nr:CDP-glycerol glycerophosphotransferase family protein [Virgibacillus pantothenticus]